MSNFKIGEKVVCVFAPQNKYCQPRKVNEIYTITDIYTCKHGIQNLNINNQIGEQEITECTCGCEIKGIKYYTNSKYFRKLDHQFGDDICTEILKKVKEESLISVN